MFKKISLLFFSIINSKPSQLFHRIKLIIKRKILSNFASDSFALKVAIASDKNVNISEKVPKALFKSRNHLTRKLKNGKLQVGFLNEWRNLEFPMDWHPREMKKGTRLWLLNLHYMEFIESIESDDWFLYVKDWIKNNMPYKKNYWLDNWNSYSLSVRVVVWMQQYQKKGSHLSNKDKNIFIRSLLAQIRFLEKNLELDIGGNHLIKNVKAILWASKFFVGDEANKWNKFGTNLLRRITKEQITPDGVHFELSPSYHAQVFADFLECYSILDHGDQKAEMKEILTKMAKFLNDVTHPDGLISLFGDGGLNMSYSSEECLAIFDKLIGKKIKHSKVISYPNAGFFGLRNKDRLILMDAAELGAKNLPGHGHGDALSFEFSCSGQRVLIDPGVFEYDEGELRAFSRSTLNHNTVSLDNKDQSEFWKSFRVGRRAKIINQEITKNSNGILVKASHDGYSNMSGKPIHTRSILMSENKIEVKDSIINGSKQSASSRFLLAPNIKVEKFDNKLFLIEKKIKILIESSHPINIVDTVCFLDFGKLVKTKQLVMDFGLAPCSSEVFLNIC